MVEPLSILLNPYRPLPLAGVVFSEASVEAGRSVSHHWGRDNRWETIPDSVLWFASRSTSAQTGSQLDAWDERGRRRPDVTLGRLNDSLFYRQPPPGGDRTGAGAAGLSGENSRWPYACMRSPRYRKRFLNWNTARSTARRGTSALASVRTMTCWRRCSRATERGRSRCCAMRRRIIWKSSSPPSCSCRRTAHCVRR